MLAPWIMDEVKTAKLGDKRLNARLGQVLFAIGSTADGEHSRRMWRTRRDGCRLSVLREREREF